ncbi:MAG: hypothetical protein DRI84_07935 [Bacteroidetes bacterium]|nr:MAG: hypothetical protein DRI84_07935 [Bacteroidota bacterium]
MTGKKVRFYSIKTKTGYSGMFITPTKEEAVELAIERGFLKAGEEVDMRDVTVERTIADDLHSGSAVDGSGE